MTSHPIRSIAALEQDEIRTLLPQLDDACSLAALEKPDRRVRDPIQWNFLFCKPHKHIEQFPQATLLRRSAYERAAARWDELGFEGPPPKPTAFHKE